MRDAMSALDQVIAFSGSSVRDEDVATLLGLVEPKILGQTVRAIAGNDVAALLGTVADLVEVGQDLNNFCRRLSGQFRNLMVLKAGISDPSLLGIPESTLPELREQAALFSREDLLRLFDTFQKVEAGMRQASQLRFQLEMGLIELAHLARLRPIEDLIAELSSGADDPTPPAAGPRSGPAPAPPAPPSENPAPAKPGRTATAAPARNAYEAPDPERVVPSMPPPMEAPAAVSFGADPRNLLFRIASAVGRESVESLLQSLEGARLKDSTVVLQAGTAGEFIRRQVKDNLASIAEAASRVVGSRVAVVLGEPSARPAPAVADVRTPGPAGEDLLEKAKREPVVQSFLDVFPGPVKAEKIVP